MLIMYLNQQQNEIANSPHFNFQNWYRFNSYLVESYVWKFNISLINDVGSLEQLGPNLY